MAGALAGGCGSSSATPPPSTTMLATNNFFSCQDPSVEIQDCNTCFQTNCASTLASLFGTSDCAAQQQCETSCACADVECVSACGGETSSLCQPVFAAIASCISTVCEPACSSVIRVGGNDAGNDFDTGTADASDSGSTDSGGYDSGGYDSGYDGGGGYDSGESDGGFD